MSTWLAKGHHARMYSHTTTWSRGDRTYESVHYWTPSTADKTPIAVCSADQWERWKSTAHECSDPTETPDRRACRTPDGLARLLHTLHVKHAPGHGYAAPLPSWEELHDARRGLIVAIATELCDHLDDVVTRK